MPPVTETQAQEPTDSPHTEDPPNTSELTHARDLFQVSDSPPAPNISKSLDPPRSPDPNNTDRTPPPPDNFDCKNSINTVDATTRGLPLKDEPPAPDEPRSPALDDMLPVNQAEDDTSDLIKTFLTVNLLITICLAKMLLTENKFTNYYNIHNNCSNTFLTFI